MSIIYIDVEINYDDGIDYWYRQISSISLSIIRRPWRNQISFCWLWAQEALWCQSPAPWLKSELRIEDDLPFRGRTKASSLVNIVYKRIIRMKWEQLHWLSRRLESLSRWFFLWAAGTLEIKERYSSKRCRDFPRLFSGIFIEVNDWYRKGGAWRDLQSLWSFQSPETGSCCQ